ncbi:hypothetical protein DPMN_151288 [Dreissena polymorpha]|uniref:Uncharacterized protein n=1 Tax=Dreissena polymorpha TaxID=45954 RepID=A0A9D4FKX0_DREPO|nr:hypothetical protein DPMN_151288 [Dreissena polymorpha]
MPRPLFHEDRTINVASRVSNAPPPGAHVFDPTKAIFELAQDIIGTNLLTKYHWENVLTNFHEDWTINVASRVLTMQMLTPHNTPHDRQKAITKVHHKHIVLS